jgi:hypothetical protein
MDSPSGSPVAVQLKLSPFGSVADMVREMVSPSVALWSETDETSGASLLGVVVAPTHASMS